MTDWKLLLVTVLAAVCLLHCAASEATTHQSEVLLKTSMQVDTHADDGLSFRVLCYHDIRDDLRSTLAAWPEFAALDTRDLVDQFEWLRANGYHVVSFDQVLAARNGGQLLPAKSIMLTFDDGYVSTYSRVFPLLKLFGYPAVIGLVGEWLEAGPDGNVPYGDRMMARHNFLTWPQVREMIESGLVEVASHSHSLHKGALSNPQGNLISAAITRVHDPIRLHYEDDTEYMTRLRSDLARNTRLIETHTGHRPRIMIWPYGAYNKAAIDAAAAEGMPYTMNLDAGPNSPDHPLARIRRDIILFNDKISDLKRNLNQRADYDGVEQPLDRIISIDLDDLYHTDPAEQEARIGALIERVLRLHVNTIYLRAVADTDADGLADIAYFPNRHLSMRADLFNRVAWQLRTRAAIPPDFVNIYASLPTLGFEVQDTGPADLRMIADIYTDIGKNAPRVAGVVLDDDTVSDVMSDQTSSMPTIAERLIAAFKDGQPNAITAVLLQVDARRSAHSSDAASRVIRTHLQHFDFVVFSSHFTKVEANRYQHSLSEQVWAAARVPGGLDRTAFLVDRLAGGAALPEDLLIDQLHWLQRHGARNLGYVHDNALLDEPALAVIRPAISLKINPGRQP